MAALAWAPERGEVVYTNHSSAAANEIPNEHPMLVITTKNFSEKPGLLCRRPIQSDIRRTRLRSCYVMATAFLTSLQSAVYVFVGG